MAYIYTCGQICTLLYMTKERQTEMQYIEYAKSLKGDVVKLMFAAGNLDEVVCGNETTLKLVEILRDYLISLDDYVINNSIY